MPLGFFVPPIVCATIVNVFMFALLWRGDRLEARTGSAHWHYLAVFLYFAGIAAVLYAVKDKPITDARILFVVAAASEAIGVALAWFLHGAFIASRGMPMKDRAIAIAFSLILAGGMFAGVFAR